MRLPEFIASTSATRRQSASTLSLFTLFLIAVCPSLLHADWINLTGAETSPNIAELHILDDHVKLVLEISIGDLEPFKDLLSDDWLKDAAAEGRPDAAERLRRFANETFQFVTEKGEKLPAEITLIEPRTRKDRLSAYAGMTGALARRQGAKPPEDKRVVYAELRYDYGSGAEKKPNKLTITPPLDENGNARVTIGFIVYHKAVPVIDFRYLGGPEPITLDWEDPWYSQFDNPNLTRHHKSALMSFLYVEPFEVRHEVLMRVKDFANWANLELRGDRYIEVDELEHLKKRIGEFLLSKNPVLIDGKLGKPILDRSNYLMVTLTGIQIMDQAERLEISSTIVGVILAYITDGLPQEVTVEWELFTDQIQEVPATSIDPAGSFPFTVDPDANVHKWTNYLKNYRLPTIEQVSVDDALTKVELPLGSVLCLAALLPIAWLFRSRRKSARSTRTPLTVGVLLIGASLVLFPFARISVGKPAALAPDLADADAKVLLETLLKNVYRAFDFRAENDVYDKMALSVNGDLLTEIYLQSRESLAIKKAGGAQAKVKHVKVIEAAVDSRPEASFTYAIRAQWTALGTVGHWGHVHVRKNLYDALVTIAAVEGHWKIVGLEILEEKRVEPSRKPPSGAVGGASP